MREVCTYQKRKTAVKSLYDRTIDWVRLLPYQFRFSEREKRSHVTAMVRQKFGITERGSVTKRVVSRSVQFLQAASLQPWAMG